VTLDEEVIGEGSGRSKKEAEQAAASDAISIIESHRRFSSLPEDRFE
jgi:ribonuclease-3